MTRLVLLRHGEAEASTGSDFARPLTPRGQRQVRQVGERLVAEGWAPELGWTSPAARALASRDVLGALVVDAPWIVDPGFYSSGSHALLSALGRLEVDDVTVWAVGHNPHWSELPRLLAGAPVGLGTGAAARLERSRTGWRLVDVVSPG